MSRLRGIVLVVALAVPPARLAAQPEALKAWWDVEVTDPAELDAEGKPALERLELDVARGAHAWKPLYLTAREPLNPAFDIPTDAPVRLAEAFRVQDYLLVPVEEADAAPRSRTGIFWLRFEAPRTSQPGEYSFALSIRNGAQTLSLPTRLRVHDVPRSAFGRLSLTAYSNSIGLFGAFGEIAAGGERRRQFEELVATLVAAGGDTLDLSPVPAEIWPRVKVMSTGHLLDEAIEQSPEQFRGHRLPALDFSALSEPIEHAMRSGLHRCIIHTSGLREIAGDVPQRILGRPVAMWESDYERVLVWQLSELRRFLQQRGFAEVFVKISDEIGADVVDWWIDTAKLARQAGLRTMCTWTGYALRQVETRRKLAPWVDEWQMQLFSAHYIDRGADVARGLLAPDARTSMYGGGSRVLTHPTTSYRYLGWLAAHHRMDGFGVWAFFWWQELERMVTYADGVLRLSPSYVGLQQALEEGALLDLALDGLEALEASEAAGSLSASQAQDLAWARRARRRLISEDEGALVRLELRPMLRYMPAVDYEGLQVVDPQPTTFDGARPLLFELTGRMAQYAPRVLRYGRYLLADSSGPQAIVTLREDASEAELACADRICAALQAVGPGTVERSRLEALSTAQKERFSVIHVGPPPSPYRYHDYAMAANEYPESADAPPERYVIYHAPSPYNAQRTAVFLVGSDDQGTELATEIFLGALTSG
ncbi:MAG: hypothetical protein AB7Y46_11295 [Armatimonadota bacterium]